ncbi:MAG TPA: flagellar basal body rod modification protein, partial [Candidatus Kapabacteria bacterium]|nr:flagellar basal body rod modification protein [Candidatus Kapabacteria bacterium]
MREKDGSVFNRENESPMEERDNANEQAQFEWLRQHDPATGKIPSHIRERELAFAAHLPVRKNGIALERVGVKGHAETQSATQWDPRGPYNIGGRTRALGIDVNNENVILAGGVSGGMWRSSDGGATWAKTTADGVMLSTTCVAQDTRAGKTNTWYYGTGELFGSSEGAPGAGYYGHGIYKSTDDGLSWNILPSTAIGDPDRSGPPFDYIYNIITDPSNTNEDVVYVATIRGIHRSSDGGATWSTVLGNDTAGTKFTDVAITQSGVLYAALSTQGDQVPIAPVSGIFRSTDGINWTNITPSSWPVVTGLISVGIAPSNPNTVYFLAQTGGVGPAYHALWKYTYVSGDGSGSGGTWVDRSANLPSTPFFNASFVYDSQYGYDLYVRVKPDNENVVYLGGVCLYCSTDGFATQFNTQLIGSEITNNFHVDQHAMAFYPSNPAAMIVGNDGGLFTTQNDIARPVQWASLNNGYYTTQFYTVALDHGTPGNPIVIGGMQDNGTMFTGKSDVTNPWSVLLGGDGSYCAIANGRSAYYLSYQEGVIYRTYVDDNGNVSTPSFARLDPASGTGYLFIDPFILDPHDQERMFLAGGKGIWRNNDLSAIPDGNQDSVNTNWDYLSNTALSAGSISA